MENTYQKNYPDLMKGKKILYVHGFMSAGSTHTAQILRDYMPGCEVICPDLPVHPSEAMELLRGIVETEKPDLIIGTSMGGMYAEMLKGVDRILVNPAFEMGTTMSEHNMMGKQTFMNPRQDGVKEIIVTKSLVKEYKEITEQCFQNITPQEQQKVFALFGDEDEWVHTFPLFSEHYTQGIHFHGGHHLIEKAVFHYVMPIIRRIDDKQEGRERKTIFIDKSTLADDYGKPKSSLHKAYEMLIENYNVFFTAPAPTNQPALIAETQAWIEQVFSAPAWNRVIFTNQPQLLYGDYFISANEIEDFLGTQIAFGSDEFKTWEEVITFFERLGGQ